jgi:hypothetical protein
VAPETPNVAVPVFVIFTARPEVALSSATPPKPIAGGVTLIQGRCPVERHSHVGRCAARDGQQPGLCARARRRGIHHRNSAGTAWCEIHLLAVVVGGLEGAAGGNTPDLERLRTGIRDGDDLRRAGGVWRLGPERQSCPVTLRSFAT